jgi:cytochrome c5
MRFNRSVLAACLVCLFVAFSCTSALYIPTAGHETRDASLAELQAGRNAYIRKCGGCHALVLPEKHNRQEWQLLVDKMTRKIVVDSLEKENILRYLNKGK